MIKKMQKKNRESMCKKTKKFVHKKIKKSKKERAYKINTIAIFHNFILLCLIFNLMIFVSRFCAYCF